MPHHRDQADKFEQQLHPEQPNRQYNQALLPSSGGYTGAINISGEQRSAINQAADAIPTISNEYMEADSLTPEQMYNVDAGYWKMLPDKVPTVTTDARETLGYKQTENKLTMFSACSGTGTHKLGQIEGSY